MVSREGFNKKRFRPSSPGLLQTWDTDPEMNSPERVASATELV